jgi:hypothetical protein
MFRLLWFTKLWSVRSPHSLRLGRWFLVLWLGIAHVQCLHAPLKPTPIPENKEGTLQIIVDEGDSAQPMYASSGDKILYISKHRLTHSQDQIYEKDLKSGVERRITFQNGSTFRPHYTSRENAIIYSSSTDELKENPPLLYPTTGQSKMPFPYQEPMELYIHSLNGLDIHRLTEHRGFDGEVDVVGNNITFTRVVAQKTEIHELNLANKSQHVLKGLGVNPAQYITSPDGKNQAWVEWDENYGVCRLHLQKGKEKSVEIAGDFILPKTDLIFSPDSKWLLWAQREANHSGYDLWIAGVEGSHCARRVKPLADGERRDPALSSDMRWLAFSTKTNDRSRIARTGFMAPTGPCPASP